MTYNIGDNIVDDKRNLTITNKQILGEKYHKKTYYKYRCNKCGYDCGSGYRNGKFIEELWVSNWQITEGCGCSCCNGKTTSVNINSIAKVRPDLIKYFYNVEDSYKYTLMSNKKVRFLCPECNTISKEMSVDNFATQGFNCPKCSDKISIGEKIVYLLLLNLDIDFIKEFSFKNSALRYDFYIPLSSTIIEVHGRQHYDGSFQSYKDGKNLKQEQLNDKYKYDYAIQNGIKNYIVIDARKSDFEFIRNSIINELSTAVDISNVDWERLKKDTFNTNIVKDVSTYWESHPNITYEEMSAVFHFCRTTIRKYLETGKSLGWCSFSTSRNNPHYHNPYKLDAPDSTIPIRCIDSNIYFKGACLCSKVSEDVFGFKLWSSTLRHILKGLKSKSRKIKYSFEYVTKEEFNDAIKKGLRCYGSPYAI